MALVAVTLLYLVEGSLKKLMMTPWTSTLHWLSLFLLNYLLILRDAIVYFSLIMQVCQSCYGSMHRERASDVTSVRGCPFLGESFYLQLLSQFMTCSKSQRSLQHH